MQLSTGVVTCCSDSRPSFWEKRRIISCRMLWHSAAPRQSDFVLIPLAPPSRPLKAHIHQHQHLRRQPLGKRQLQITLALTAFTPCLVPPLRRLYLRHTLLPITATTIPERRKAKAASSPLAECLSGVELTLDRVAALTVAQLAYPCLRPLAPSSLVIWRIGKYPTSDIAAPCTP